MMRTRPVFLASGALVAAGFLFGLGMRASQWLVPAPPEQLTLCLPDAAGDDDGSRVLIEEAPDAAASLRDREQPVLAPSSRQSI
jgi:hypothetical protein